MMKQFFINDTFALGGWVTPKGELLKESTFKDIAESGINLLFCSIIPKKDFDSIKQSLVYLDKYGIKLIVDVTEVMDEDFDEEDFLPRLDFYKRSNAIIGISLGDEPGLNHIPKLKEAADYLQPIKGDLLIYINNLPIYATTEQIKGGWWTPEASELKEVEYSDFINQITDCSKTDILSYDHYPFRGQLGVSDPRYFVQLSTMKEIAKNRNLPLFNFTQVTSWKKGEIRSMTLAEISCLSATSICYGVTGIVYFCCCTPESGNVELFEDAMLDKNGNKTEHFYFVKTVNDKLKMVANCIYDTEQKGIIRVGNCFANIPTKDCIDGFGSLKEADGNGFIIGCFENKLKKVYVIVNVSVLNDSVIKLKFDDCANKKVLLANNESRLAGEIALNLDAGGFAVIVEN